MIDLESECLHVSLRFQAMAPDPYRQGSAFSNQLLARLGIRVDSAAIWVDQFSPFTVLYPLLQREGYPEIAEDDARHACVAHLHFLIHAFIEDRSLDGQVELDSEQVSYAKSLMVTGFQLLDELPRGDRRDSRCYLKSLDVHDYAQINGYDANDHARRGIHRSRVLRIAAGRAAHGSLAPLALLRDAGCHGPRYRLAQNAFDCVVTGMQWLDDLEDWREDLAVGDENLLLVSLRRDGRDPYSHPDNGVRDANVGHALVANGVFETAAANALRWLDMAAERMERTGCNQMVELVRRMTCSIDERVEVQLEYVENEIGEVARDRVHSVD